MTRPSFGGGAPRFSEPSAAEGPVIDATVNWFNGEKGFGFAELGDGSGDAFLHISVLQADGFGPLQPGTKLTVQVGQGQKGKQITKVHTVDESTASEFTPRPSAGGGAPRPQRPSRPSVDTANAVEMTGTVKWFNSQKGFGFVASDNGGKDVFVHVSVLNAAGLTGLADGQPVTMRVIETPKGREAVSISA